MTSDATPRLEDFPYRILDNVRFADLDPNHHVNNAIYATYFETGRVTLMKDRSYGLMPEGLSWMMVRLDMHFRAELRWPGGIEMGLVLVKFGRTSVTFDQVVFSRGKCVASARSTIRCRIPWSWVAPNSVSITASPVVATCFSALANTSSSKPSQAPPSKGSVEFGVARQ